ncbi:cytochrome b [Streptomyces sp. DT171]|uniref:cytochrome bc1 complex cytochrome b subunit n=1 Tax=Streptomyces sp. DT171 TaxID=3416524 RepID=UPI003CFAD65C
MRKAGKAGPGERAGRVARTGFEGVDARLPLAESARALLRKAFPEHWSFLLGELALYSFVVLLLTGVFLTLFFDPSMAETVYQGSYVPLHGVRMSEAYASTLDISFEVRGGLLIRQVHHWASLVFLSSIGVHLLRVFFTGAFRRPREVNWMVGVTMFLLALLEGFAGYSLPDDLLSGTGLRTAQGIMLSIPVIGSYVSFFVFGAEFPGEDIVSRLYPMHVLLVPGLLLALISLHLLLVVHLKHTQWRGRGRTGRNAVGQPLFPHYTAKSGGLFLIVFGLLAVLAAVAQINPVWAYGPFRPDQVSTDAQPDWYVGFLEGALRLMPGVETRLWGHTVMWNVFLPAVVLPGLLFVILYLYPFFERWVTGDGGERHLCDRPRDRPTRTGLGVAALVCYGVLLLAGGQDVVSYVFHLPFPPLTWVFRVLFVVGPVAAFWLTKRLCLALQKRERELLSEGEETGEVTQTVEGAHRPGHRPLGDGARWVALTAERPRPLPEPRGPGDGRDTRDVRAPRLRRLVDRSRSAASAWYYQDRVEPPLDARLRDEVAALNAGPTDTDPGPGERDGRGDAG